MPKYFIIDVFTKVKFEGAQIAVIPDASALSDNAMQKLARELNLTETVFICAGADGVSDYRLRVFSPTAELDFAGHPLLAAGYVLHHAQTQFKTSFNLQLNTESVQLSTVSSGDETRIQFSVQSPSNVDAFVPSAKELGEILHLDEKDIDQSELRPMLVTCRGEYLLVPVKSIAAFNAARFNINKWTTSFVATLASQIGVCCKAARTDTADYRLRLLGKQIADGMDPPVGSAAPAMGVYLFGAEPAGLYTAVLQRGGDGLRKSLIDISVEKSNETITAIQVGGYAVQIGNGFIDGV